MRLKRKNVMIIDISIIVPVFNGEHFLEETLNSLISQSYEKCEIIAIDDGSTDRSLEILRKYALTDKRLVVISTQNQGICLARNLGIKMAKGKYIMFCDHDDTYNPDFVQKAFHIITSKDYDYVKFSCNEIKICDGKVIKTNTLKLNSKEFMGSRVSNILYEYTNFCEYIWDGIYKKEVIEKVNGFDGRFTSGSEDVDLFLKLVVCAQSCATSSWVAYNHFIRNKSSTSQKYSENSYNAVIEMYERKMNLSDCNNIRCREYCRIKTRNFLYTILANLSSKTCPFRLVRVYEKLIELKKSKQFVYHLNDVHFRIRDIKTYPIILYRSHCILLLALVCIVKRKL